MKIIPSLAIRSMFGVGIFESGFNALTSPNPWSSARIKTMLGSSEAATALHAEKQSRTARMGRFLITTKGQGREGQGRERG